MSNSRSQSQDRYVNVFNAQVAQTANNTLTFEEIDFGLNLFDKVGILIHRLEMYSNVATAQLVSGADILRSAITQSNQISSISPSERAIVDLFELRIIQAGTPANNELLVEPVVHDWSQVPGGGLLVAPKPLYLAVDTSGYTATETVDMRIYFTIKKLRDAEYFELLESRRFYG